MSNEVSNSKVVTSLLWKFAERMGAQGVTFVVSVVLARILDPNVYGVVALVTVITTVLQVFVDSGLGNALIQKKDADNIDFSTVFYFNLVISVIIYIGVFFCAPFIAAFYENSELTSLVRVLGLVLLIAGVKNVQQAYVAKNMLFKKFFFSTLGGTIGAAVVGIWMALNGYGVWALIFQNLFNQLVDMIILWITVKWRPQLAFSWRSIKKLFSFGWKLLVSRLLDTLYKQIVALIIGKKYTPDNLAFYNKGESWPSLIMTNVNSSIDSVLLPSMAMKQDDIDRLKAMTRRAIKTSTYILMPVMVGLFACAEPLIRLVLTEKWLPIVPYMRLFCIIYAFYPVHTANLNALKALGKSDIFLKLEIIKKAIGVAAIVIAMRFGVWAMACSVLIVSMISLIINAFPNRILLGYHYLQQFKDIVPELLTSFFMGAVVLAISFLSINDYLMLLVQILVGISLYVAISYVFKLDSFLYAWNIIKNKRLKKKGNE